MTAAALVCGSCGTELPPNSKFCNECGAAVATAPTPAEYKQVTVLFADVVHSMDIAAAVGAERLREIMTELVERSAAVVKRYGGTLSQFTGDGVMAVFGAPMALEDHAVRACLAALGIQDETVRLAAEVQDRDGIDLRLRVGLNSGQVIAGEIGSGTLGYTAIGERAGSCSLSMRSPRFRSSRRSSKNELEYIAGAVEDIHLIPGESRVAGPLLVDRPCAVAVVGGIIAALLLRERTVRASAELEAEQGRESGTTTA